MNRHLMVPQKPVYKGEEEMKKIFVMCLLLGCLVGCGTENTASTEATESSVSSMAVESSASVAEKVEPVMCEKYPDIQDFGKTYGVQENTEKVETLRQFCPDEWVMLVYDVPEEQREDIETWKQSLEESGFVIVDEQNSDDGDIVTYTKEETKEKILLSTGVSTDDPAETVMTVTITDFSIDGVLPTKDDPDMDYLIEEQNRAQVNGDYLIQDGWIYGLTWKDNGDPILAKKRTDGSDYTKMLDGSLTNIYLKDAYIYGAMVYGKKQGIYKMRASGEECQRILDMDGINIQLCNDYIYYTPDTYLGVDEATQESAHLYRCDLDGNNVEEIISKPVYCWYVFENTVLYQNDRDNESLHIYNLEKQTDIKVNDMISYSPIYDGEYIYYIGKKEEVCNIWRVKPDGSGNEKLSNVETEDRLSVYKNYVYFINSEDNGRIYRMDKDGSNLTQISQDKNCRKPYFCGNKLIYRVYAKKYEYIEKNVICDPDGSNAEKILLRGK